MITVTHYGVPVPKGRPRAAKAGTFISFYTPKKTRDFEAALKVTMAETMHLEAYDAPFKGPLVCSMLVDLPIPVSWKRSKAEDARSGALRPWGRPDLDNYLKVAMDAGNNVLWYDDGQIVQCTVGLWYSDKPKMTITAEPWITTKMES